MKFGIQFFPSVSPQQKRARDYFNESLDIAEEAEKLGFTHARTVEHYFERYGGFSPNPIVFLSALSQRTKTMRLVTGAVLPVFNHPLKLAGEIAMLDAISNGRLDVGFARAFLPHEFRRFNISPDQSQARFREGIEQVNLLLTQENVSSNGEFHAFENLTSLPRPTQTPRPKFWIAATQTEESFEFAAKNGYALMTIPIGPIKPLVARYREVWKQCGHPGEGEIMIAFHMFCHRDGKASRDIAREPFEDYFKAVAESVSDWTSHKTVSKDYRDYDKTMAKMKASTLEGQIESGGAWIGTPDEIKANIAGAFDKFGRFEHASIQVNFGTLDFTEAQRSLRLFAAEVMPTFTS